MGKRMLSLALLGLIPMAGEAMAQRYVDPRVNMSGYRDWCAAQGGRVDTSGGVACVGARSSSSPGSYSPGAQVGGMMGQALGQAMAPLFYQFGQQIGCMLIGGCTDQRAAEEANRRAAQIEEQRQAAEAERRRKEEEARRKFQEAQQRMLGEMRGFDPDGLQLRGLDAPALNVAPARGLLGATELKPRELTASAALTTQGRVRCAVSLLYKANKAYVEINTQAALWEAAYLSNEAAGIAGSAAYRPNVECPSDPPAAGAAGSTPQAQAQLQRIQQSAIMFARVQQLIADRETQQAAVANAEEKVTEAERQLRETRARLSRQQSAVPPAPSATGTQAQQDDGALAEALAALKEAEAANQASRELLKEQRAQLGQMEKQLDNSTKMLQRSMKGWANIDKSAGAPG